MRRALFVFLCSLAASCLLPPAADLYPTDDSGAADDDDSDAPDDDDSGVNDDDDSAEVP